MKNTLAKLPCPACGGRKSKVTDARMGKKGTAIRRRRVCLECSHRYSTSETVLESYRGAIPEPDPIENLVGLA